MKKGTIEQAEELHGLVAQTLLERIRSEGCTATDIRNAMDWLHRHGITKFVADRLPNTLEDGLEATGPSLPDLHLYEEDEDAA